MERCIALRGSNNINTTLSTGGQKNSGVVRKFRARDVRFLGGKGSVFDGTMRRGRGGSPTWSDTAMMHHEGWLSDGVLIREALCRSSQCDAGDVPVGLGSR